MNIAMIIAGGSGKRTNQDIPKQFLNVLDKPIVIYTLEKFQNHNEIDAILVVCLAGWEEVLNAYGKQFDINKLKWIVPGGNNVYESIKNGLVFLKDICNKDDIVVIHDGIRPMVSEDIISDCIEKCKTYGNGISSMPIFEQIFNVLDEKSTDSYINREKIRCLQTPQAYNYSKILKVYESENSSIDTTLYANNIMSNFGEKLYFAKGSSKNIKITTVDDIEIFKALLTVTKDSYLK